MYFTSKEFLVPGGRPSKFTEETRNKIIQALRGGNYRKVAAQYAGVSDTTLRNWLLLAQDPQAPPEYLEFLAAVEKAEADAEVADLALIRRAAQDGTWAAAAWVRERKNPERWGKRDRTEVSLTGADGGPVDVRVGFGADPAAIASLAAMLAGRAMERQDPLGPTPIDTSGSEALEGGQDPLEPFRLSPGDLSASAPSLRKQGHLPPPEDPEPAWDLEEDEAPSFPEVVEFQERKADQAAFEEIVRNQDPDWTWEVGEAGDFGDWSDE